MTYYAALDVSLRSVAVCIIDDQGNYQFERKVPSELEDIVQCLEEFDGGIELIGFEAGMLTQYLSYGLTAVGFEMVCLETHHVKESLKAMRNKTDKNDVRGIAQLLRMGWYQAVHVTSVESHEIRALLSSRRVILRKCVDLENELRGLLWIFGTKLPSSLAHGTVEEVVRYTSAPIQACLDDGRFRRVGLMKQSGAQPGTRSSISAATSCGWLRLRLKMILMESS
jgi:transposase